jgi:hypothetical protein
MLILLESVSIDKFLIKLQGIIMRKKDFHLLMVVVGFCIVCIHVDFAMYSFRSVEKRSHALGSSLACLPRPWAVIMSLGRY